MTIIDLSKDKPWRTQRDNTWKPHSECNVTALRMAADNAGIPCPGDENLFMAFVNQPRWYKMVHDRFRWAWEEKDGEINYIYPPNEIHDVLAAAFNEWVDGAGDDEFNLDCSRRELAGALLKGHGVALSGNFPYRGGRSIPHIVCLSGFLTEQDVEMGDPEGSIDPTLIESWILDDPYGDYRTEYNNQNGNNVIMPMDDFVKYIKDRGKLESKWAHILRRTV